jgi:hypothetical protein
MCIVDASSLWARADEADRRRITEGLGALRQAGKLDALDGGRFPTASGRA